MGKEMKNVLSDTLKTNISEWGARLKISITMDEIEPLEMLEGLEPSVAGLAYVLMSGADTAPRVAKGIAVAVYGGGLDDLTKLLEYDTTATILGAGVVYARCQCMLDDEIARKRAKARALYRRTLSVWDMRLETFIDEDSPRPDWTHELDACMAAIAVVLNKATGLSHQSCVRIVTIDDVEDATVMLTPEELDGWWLIENHVIRTPLFK